MAQINRVRLPDGRVVRPTEWSSTPLFSTVEIDNAASIAPLEAFSYGIGGTVPGSPGPRRANFRDTNMDGDGGILPENQELLLYSIMIEFYQHVSSAADYRNGNDNLVPDPPHVSAENMGRIQRDMRLILRIANTKEYAAHPLGLFPAAMGVHPYLGAATNADANAIHIGRNGGVDICENRRFATPHRVAPGEALEATLEAPSGSVTGLDFGADADARVRARIYFDGYRKRPVA